MDFGSGLYDRLVNEILSEIKLLCNLTLVIRICIVLKKSPGKLTSFKRLLFELHSEQRK